jgi:myo-inositol-1(or 4)-monophosphatase
MDLFSADWLGVCRRAVAAQRMIFEDVRDIGGRTVYEGVGEGGDRTLAIDRRCEDAVFAELEALAAQDASFVAVSEERGEVEFGVGGAARVVIDPIDGSLNARRMLPSHSLSIAVASGDSMAEVEFGYVYDFGAEEEFVARRGEGATLDGERIEVGPDGDKLELLGFEAAEPERAIPALEALAGRVYRVRVVGSIAITAADVAAGRFDAMISLRPCRRGAADCP